MKRVHFKADRQPDRQENGWGKKKNATNMEREKRKLKR